MDRWTGDQSGGSELASEDGIVQFSHVTNDIDHVFWPGPFLKGFTNPVHKYLS
jgi:hypothetical protein